MSCSFVKYNCIFELKPLHYAHSFVTLQLKGGCVKIQFLSQLYTDDSLL